MAMLKMIPIGVSLVSKCSTSGILKTLNAYTWPIDRWTASAAGGISQRLYPSGAIVRSRSRNESSTNVSPLGSEFVDLSTTRGPGRFGSRRSGS